MTKLPVAILGATGTVGQKFIALLAEHPWFEIVQLAASAARDGKRFGDEVRWRELTPLPEHIAEMRLTTVAPIAGVRIAFSALDASVAREVEPAFAHAGVFVVSNASAFRMADDVPLLIPEVNADHLSLLARQQRERGWTGAIVVNPNCSTAALVTAIAPLHRAYGLRKAVVATLQAASGAGYPGVPSLDLLGNVIPLIGGEEEKIEAELRKILGRVDGERIVEAEIVTSAMVHRVPVVDGHMVSASLEFETAPTPTEAIATLRAFRGADPVPTLPSSPALPVEVDDRPDRPQSRLDLDRGRGMTVTVGRVRPCPLHHLRLVALGHNLVRGAAGAAVQNAELLVASGLLEE
ncbi:MAG: aspartate-semialdehyde dehydrogenase [Gemmatimonadetes bacterium]|nr:aspartate-semialdehyde dehydrogenase [Gemmatimonadota bacterium]MBL0179411.1 aspartate-semialdehyde dehydrogenase [Gemmatimonadota bacterium]